MKSRTAEEFEALVTLGEVVAGRACAVIRQSATVVVYLPFRLRGVVPLATGINFELLYFRLATHYRKVVPGVVRVATSHGFAARGVRESSEAFAALLEDVSIGAFRLARRGTAVLVSLVVLKTSSLDRGRCALTARLPDTVKAPLANDFFRGSRSRLSVCEERAQSEREDEESRRRRRRRRYHDRKRYVRTESAYRE